jgi:multidrug efflux pump subunit AcrA (membrane-fusion protein)
VRTRLVATGLALVVAGLQLSACTEVETEPAVGYEPSKLEPVKGEGEDAVRVTFTSEGAKRIGLETATVQATGDHEVVPYAALVYDPEGKTYVYTSPKPLSYLRKPVKVDRIDGDRVALSEGPPVGTEVVTVGAAEVYGTELEIASSG